MWKIMTDHASELDGLRVCRLVELQVAHGIAIPGI